jgi:hypothetical protein
MPYRFKRSDGSVEQVVRRIATEHTECAIEEIDGREIGIDETVHQLRKRCKKVRGLIRLVRPAFDYGDENDRFRDVAKSLSGLRDARTAIKTYDAVVEHFDEQIERRAFALIRRRLTLHYKEGHADTDVGQELARFRVILLPVSPRASTAIGATPAPQRL